MDVQYGNGNDDIGHAWATSGQGVGSWIKLNFATSTTISSMRYANRDAFYDESNRLVELQFSNGKKVQITLVAASSSSDDFDRLYNFPPVTTSYVKIVVKSTYATVNNGADEIQFGIAGKLEKRCQDDEKSDSQPDKDSDQTAHGHVVSPPYRSLPHESVSDPHRSTCDRRKPPINTSAPTLVFYPQ